MVMRIDTGCDLRCPSHGLEAYIIVTIWLHEPIPQSSINKDVEPRFASWGRLDESLEGFEIMDDDLLGTSVKWMRRSASLTP